MRSNDTTATPAGRVRSALAYRPDIDGLRALAVVSVMLFHADIAGFGGGFVGVDVFFVISGYLITSVIVKELAAGGFSLLSFYDRRIRRIFPALFAVLFTCQVVGLFVLLPDELKSLGQGTIAATLSVSNVMFWRWAGYFDVAAEQNPLLHTWSLGVEEQFYLIFPLVLLALVRANLTYTRVIALTLLASFVLAVWGVRAEPTATFFLAPTRAWELLLGALIAAGALPPVRERMARDVLSVAGLALIAWSVLTFSANTPFPGVAALVPCIGAGLVIHAGSEGRSLGGRALSLRPVVFAGLISYSLYLWHWPLLVFAGLYAPHELTVAERLIVLLAAALVAVASWRWIETPFRAKPPLLSRPRLFATATGVVFVASIVGLGLHLTDGLPGRLRPDVARLAAGANDRNPDIGKCFSPPVQAVREGRLCEVGARGQARPTFVLWGDSHAETLRPLIGDVATRAGQAGLFAGTAFCPPLPGVTVSRSDRAPRQDCLAFNEAVLDLVMRGGIETVVLDARWSVYATGVRPWLHRVRREVYLNEVAGTPRSTQANEAVFRDAVRRLVARLVESGKKVVLVGPVPEIGRPTPSALATIAWRGSDIDLRPTRRAFEARNRIVLSVLAELEGSPQVRVVYPHTSLCDGTWCRLESDGRPLYKDGDHLSRQGASFIARIFEGVL